LNKFQEGNNQKKIKMVSWIRVNGVVEYTAGLVAFIKLSALPTFTKVHNQQWQFGGR